MKTCFVQICFTEACFALEKIESPDLHDKARSRAACCQKAKRNAPDTLRSYLLLSDASISRACMQSKLTRSVIIPQMVALQHHV